MNDAQIETLKKELKNARNIPTTSIVWNPDSTTARIIQSIGKHAEEGDELCAMFSNGEYVALYNCPLSDFALVTRFQDESQ